MKALLSEHGVGGYGRFWILCEQIASSPGAKLNVSNKVMKLNVAREMGFNEHEFDTFISFISDPDIGLIKIESGFVTTDQLQEDYEKVSKKREHDRNGYNTDNDPTSEKPIPSTEMQISTSENIQSRVEKSRENKSSNNNEITTTFLIRECEKFGFNITENLAKNILDNGIKQEQITGEHGFPRYAANIVNSDKYNELSSEGKLKMFRSFFRPTSTVFDEYQEWIKNGCRDRNKLEEKTRNSLIPDAEETERMLNEMARSRQESTTGNLTDELKKVISKKAVVEDVDF